MLADQLDRSGIRNSQSDEQYIEEEPREKLASMRHDAPALVHERQTSGCAIDAAFVTRQRFSPPTPQQKQPHGKSPGHDKKDFESGKYDLVHAV